MCVVRGPTAPPEGGADILIAPLQLLVMLVLHDIASGTHRRTSITCLVIVSCRPCAFL